MQNRMGTFGELRRIYSPLPKRVTEIEYTIKVVIRHYIHLFIMLDTQLENFTKKHFVRLSQIFDELYKVVWYFGLAWFIVPVGCIFS